MEQSKLYDLLESKLFKWKKAEEEKDDCGFAKEEAELKQRLTAELTENSQKLLTHYALAIENRIDGVYCGINKKILNFGVEIGMELQKAFNECSIN